MAPTRRKEEVKSLNIKEVINDRDVSWISEIEDLTLIEERWTCVIGLMVETRLEHQSYLELFNEAAEDQTRESVFSLSYEKLVRGTKLLAKSDPRQGICHFANKRIEEGGEESMGPWLICRLIKFFVNREKMKNLEVIRRRVRTEEDIAEEIEALGVKSKEAKSLDKRNTKLRKRGEEWRDRVRVDDAPIDGHDLYVVLSGFYDPRLPAELSKAGLPLTVVFKMLRNGEDAEFDHSKARDFWSSFEPMTRDPKTAFEYEGVILQTFCPPGDVGETETLKSDAYRRISFLMYDIADITRNHFSYIKEMKIQPNLDEVRPKFQPTETYDAIMKLVPEECASVPIVLDALLCQVEGLEIDIELENKRETVQDSFRSRIDYLNEQFDLIDVTGEESRPENINPRFFLHGDDLGRDNRHCLWKNSLPQDFGVRVLRQFAVSSLWSKVPVPTSVQNSMHAHHIGLLSDCFDVGMDRSTTSHYLHLLLFDKIINGEEVPRSDIGERQDLPKTVSFPSLNVNARFTKSESIIGDEKMYTISPLPFRSDSAMEYGKEISETFECPELFRLVDTKKILGAGSIGVPSSSSPNLDIEDFDAVQLLSSDVFSQVFFKCYQEFDSVKTRYFPPTDSVLVVFHDDLSKEDISRRRYVASIRTPVCLRDFTRFVTEEETEWIARKEEIHDRLLSEEAASRKANVDTSGNSLSSISYTDEDFILPNSIKGSELRKPRSGQSLIDRTELEASQVSAGVEGPRKAKRVKETNSLKGKERIRRRKDRINPGRKSEERIETTGSFSPLENIPSSPEPPTFLGYDVANHRVQVSGSTSEFRSEDGTVVKVKIEEWTYGESEVRIIVELLGNDLVVSKKVGVDDPTFVFATFNGISMKFGSISNSKERNVEASSSSSSSSGYSITERNYQSGKMDRESDTRDGSLPPEMAVDPGFRASWPSGLIVETIPGDASSDSFNIKQSYLSKGPECADVSSETRRVYLRDGTIIVFHDDDGVLALRSDGSVVNFGGSSNPDKRIIDADGKRWEISNGEIIEVPGRVLVRTSSDYEVGEKFSRRNDGTNILIDSEGFLAVCFPDGSRITTGYVIDEDPVLCEWTEEEIRKFYPDENGTENILRDDGFVSVLLTCCMEHKNYATVTYDRSKNDCAISMPGDVRVRITSDTLFSVTVGTPIYLKVNKDGMVFVERKGKTPEECSTSVFDLGRSSGLGSPFLRTTDSIGNVFTVDFDGKTSYKKSERKEEDREYYRSRKPSKGYRLFAVKRDLRAYEHLHRSEREDQKNENTPVIFYRQVPHRTNQKLTTTLTTLDPITTSRVWLQPYRVASIKPRNEDRRDLLRSTYSVPYTNCMIPYGKNGHGIRDGTRKLPLNVNVNGPDHSTPKVLLARTIQTVKYTEDNAIEELHRALGRYWEKAINNFGNYRSSVINETPENVEEREFEDWLKDFALGRRMTFDVTLYLYGLTENRDKKKSESHISKVKNSESDVSEEIEWYKSCLRDRTMMPYFRDISGACFLWVLECVYKIGGKTNEERRKLEEWTK